MIKRFFPVLIVAALFGCSDSTAPDVGLVGTWNLKTVNGSQVPVTLIPASGSNAGFGVVSGTFTFNDDGSYSSFIQYSGNASHRGQGVYVRNGETITITGGGFIQTFVTYNGQTVTAAPFPSETYVFRK